MFVVDLTPERKAEFSPSLMLWWYKLGGSHEEFVVS